MQTKSNRKAEDAVFTSLSTVRVFIGGVLCLSTLALGLGGCSTPQVTPQLPIFQSKIGHAADWNALARRTTTHFATSLNGDMPAVFVAPGPADMPFAAAYRSLLEQELMRKGFRVQETAVGAVVLRFGVQTFLYANGNEKLPVDYASFWTTIYALGSQLRHVASLDTGVAIAAGAGPIIDILKSMTDTTKAEVMLTVTVEHGTDLLYRDTETMYVHPEELPFYWTHVPDFLPQAKQTDIAEISLPVRGDKP